MSERRTETQVLSGKANSRVRHTRHVLHQALIALIREKDYKAIAVREILDRAHVSRSTFYMHFADKDELLATGIEQMVTTLSGIALTRCQRRHPKLLAQFVVSTFIVVLDWWLDTRSQPLPHEVHQVFCSLVGRASHGEPSIRR